MKQSIEYHVEMTVFEPQRKSHRQTFTSHEAAYQTVLGLQNGYAVAVIEAIAGRADYGNFYLFFSFSSRVHIMLHEHREHFARDPDVCNNENNVKFRDEDGSCFEIVYRETLSRSQALAALEYWLRSFDQWPFLTWT